MTASPFTLEGKVALITGGAGGIGLAGARMFLDAGARVALVDLNGDAATAAANALGDGAIGLAADVTDETQVERVIGDAVAALGGVDILVNSAGLSLREPTLDLPLDNWNRVVDVNMTATFLMSRAVARRMIDAGSSGAIVNLGSIMGESGGGLYPNLSYHATKGAIVNITRALAVEWGPSGIRVNSVAPTWVRTGFIGPLAEKPKMMAQINATMPLGRIAEPEEVAAAILFLAGPAASMITGVTLPVDGGFLAR